METTDDFENVYNLNRCKNSVNSFSFNKKKKISILLYIFYKM